MNQYQKLIYVNGDLNYHNNQIALKLLTSLKSFRPPCQTGFSSASFWDVHSHPILRMFHVSPKTHPRPDDPTFFNTLLMEAAKLLWTHSVVFNTVKICPKILMRI